MKFDLVYSAIKKRIYSYSHGDRLPSEQQLSAELSVSRMTIRKALTVLKSEGFIASHKGKGHFLINHPLIEDSDSFNFIETLPKLDQYDVLHFELLTATLNLSQLIQCNNGDKLFLVKKQLCSAGNPKIMIDQYIPFNQFPTLSVQDMSNNDILQLNLCQQLNEHIRYQVVFKPIKAELALQKMLHSATEQMLQQAFITAKKLDNSLIYFTIISYDPSQINIYFNHQL